MDKQFSNNETLFFSFSILYLSARFSNAFCIIPGMGGCEVRDLPMVENSRRILVKPFRGNVVKYKCRTHYRLFGQNMFHCADGGKWGGGEPPICTRKFCFFSVVYTYSEIQTKTAVKPFF